MRRSVQRYLLVLHGGMIEIERYDREGDATLFRFCDFYLFELFLLVYLWPPNGLKPRRVADFVINYCWNCLESEVEKQESIILAQFFFSFKVFNLFNVLLSLNKYFWTVINTSEVSRHLSKFLHSIKHVLRVPLQYLHIKYIVWHVATAS